MHFTVTHLQFGVTVCVLRLIYCDSVEYTSSTLNSCADLCEAESLSLIQCTSICAQLPECQGIGFNVDKGTCCICSTIGVPEQRLDSGTVLYRTVNEHVCVQDLIEEVIDDQLTSSSSYFANSEQMARLNTTHIPGHIAGWCPETSSSSQDYIQARFNNTKEIMGIGTQGRNGFTPLQCVTSYKVSYSVDCITYSFVQDSASNPKTFPGNEDKDTVAWNDFHESILAVCIRVYPVAFLHFPCLRFGISGCDF